MVVWKRLDRELLFICFKRAICALPSAICYPLSATCHLPSAIFYLLSTIFSPSRRLNHFGSQVVTVERWHQVDTVSKDA